MTVPQTLVAGRYRLVEALGRGGMGRVWLAHDEMLNRHVAAKEILPPEGLTDLETEELRARTLREARTAARLSHPNLVRVYDVVDTAAAPWIVMEFVPSRSLHEVVATEGPLPPERAAQIGLGVLAGLRAAHRAGVLHRDVKPANVLITDDDRVVLTDFGLATHDGDPSITRTGMVLGSPSFMSPERALDGFAGPASDLWSLGATLYFALTGRAPYERGSTMATLAALATEEPPKLSRRAGRMKPVLDGLLRREPKSRPDAATTERLLRAAVGPTWTSGMPAPMHRPIPTPRPAPVIEIPAAPRPVEAPPVEAAPVETLPVLAPRQRRLVASVAVVVALVTLAALAAWAIRPAGDDQNGRRFPVSPVASASTVPPTRPATTSPATTPPTATSPPDDDSAPVLPAGWRMYTDRTGFSLAVPASWPVTRQGSIVYFREPGGGRVLGIDQTDQPEPDPVADWAAKEQYRVARGDFPSYRRVRLVEVDYFDKAADWEFTYLGSSGSRVHVNNRGFITSPTQAYGMWWSTPDSQWDRYLPDLRLIQRSFVPGE
jgi:serine/threonine protein kinase